MILTVHVIRFQYFIADEEMMEQKFDVSSSHKDQACSVVKGGIEFSVIY